ncbi:MAG: NADPH:quinone oxidoreductase family protein [Endozoicomonas sp.]
MKALLCKKHGTPEDLVIEEVPSLSPGKSNVLVRVHAAGLNFPDTLIIQGKYQIQPPLPFCPGSEMAGVVLETGENVTGFKPGDRVFGLTGFGSFAEEVVVPAHSLTRVPEALSMQQAAGFSMVYGTSYHALKQRGRLKEGETLLVMGAGGGVGLTAVELGHAMGARVIAAASSDEKLAAAKSAGADDVINYTSEPLKETIKQLTGGKGADVVYDPVGGELAEQALRATNWNGRYLVIGFASGDIPSFPANLPLLKGCDICGVFWGSFTSREPEANRQNFTELFSMVASGAITPKVTRVYPFTDYAGAFNALGNRSAVGKLVLDLAQE